MTYPGTTPASDCLPTYIVLDTSGSMNPHVASLNKTLEVVVDSVADSPRVAEFAHISIISFNTRAHLILPLTDVQGLTSIPEVGCGGETNYGEAFRMVKERINVDVPELRHQGRTVLRPTVFMLTDGGPTDDDWQESFAELVDDSWSRRPHVVTFGFGDANAGVLSQISTKMAFLAKDAYAGNTAITNFLGELLRTLIKSSSTGNVELPTEVEGFKTVSLPREYME
ncbi:MAG: VWA domain-containing protein [Hamadaea sp.]|uniref:vWA domain-containing protein n=1 Tax=Hamadaea sp. TaxID=2024425 RepID=UPI0017C1EBE2|nr:VWA domain-containing protein [Hamadaea sp.]NUT22252.1 VWA domain-containing protein [Hamadaea sp.]